MADTTHRSSLTSTTPPSQTRVHSIRIYLSKIETTLPEELVREVLPREIISLRLQHLSTALQDLVPHGRLTWSGVVSACSVVLIWLFCALFVLRPWDRADGLAADTAEFNSRVLVSVGSGIVGTAIVVGLLVNQWRKRTLEVFDTLRIMTEQWNDEDRKSARTTSWLFKPIPLYYVLFRRGIVASVGVGTLELTWRKPDMSHAQSGALRRSGSNNALRKSASALRISSIDRYGSDRV